MGRGEPGDAWAWEKGVVSARRVDSVESLTGLTIVDLTAKGLETDEPCTPSRTKDRWSIEDGHVWLDPQVMACSMTGMASSGAARLCLGNGWLCITGDSKYIEG